MHVPLNLQGGQDLPGWVNGEMGEAWGQEGAGQNSAPRKLGGVGTGCTSTVDPPTCHFAEIINPLESVLRQCPPKCI